MIIGKMKAKSKYLQFSVLLIAFLLQSKVAIAADVVNLPTEKNSFDDLYKCLTRRISSGSTGKLTTSEKLRKGELLVSCGYRHEAIIDYKALFKYDSDFKKEPLMSQLHLRINKLCSVISNSTSLRPEFSATVDQLDKPFGKCHITVDDLDEKYRLESDNGRLSSLLVQDSIPEKIRKHCPYLSKSLYRFWISDNKSAMAAIIYNPIGPFIVFSKDSGITWTLPLYLGLHRLPDCEYLILHDSRQPLVKDDNIFIEVFVRKRDLTKPGGRGLRGYQYHWEKWNKVLRIPVKVIVKDSDGDGLTDLFEERILTDPLNKDTDNDGYFDAVDIQPLTKRVNLLSASDHICLDMLGKYDNLVRKIFNSRYVEMNLMTEIEQEESLIEDTLTETELRIFTEPPKENISVLNTTFVATERDVLKSITGRQRLIVLNEHSRAKYEKKFGATREPCYAAFDLFLNSLESKAFLSISFNSQTEIFRCEQNVDGQWSVILLKKMMFD